MFVRWQLYRSQALDPRLRKDRDNYARLKAILVESVRVDGQPRQRHVAFLGSTNIKGSDRKRFWYDVTRQLDRLGNRISAKQRERIGAAIARKVGGQLLTKKQIAEFERGRDQLLNSL